MKKLIAVCLLLASIHNLHAQEENDRKFRGGIKVAPLLSWLKTSVDDPDNQSIENEGVNFGFSYGIMFDWFLNDNYLVATELRIAHLKSSYTYNLNTVPTYKVKREIRNQFIELPITLKMRTNEIGYMRYFGQFGFVPAVNIDAKADVVETYGTSPSSLKENQPVYKNTNPLVAYLLIGAGAEYNLGGNTSIVGSISWNNGFLNLWKRKEVERDFGVTDKQEFNTRPAYVALNIGVLF